jgi:hypothetical protein
LSLNIVKRLFLNLLTKSYFPFLLAVIFHFFLLLLLLSPSRNAFLKPLPYKKVAIKSYLYTKPLTSQRSFMKNNKATPKSNKGTDTIPKVLPQITSDTKINPVEQRAASPADIKTIKVEQITHTQKDNFGYLKKIDTIQQMSKLKAQLNQKLLAEEFADFNRPQGLSIMHKLPAAVPYSTIAKDRLKQIDSSTLQYSSDIAIIKLDSGTCLLKQDLTAVGIEGISATSAFKCSRTKKEKLFSAHFKKILSKLNLKQ